MMDVLMYLFETYIHSDVELNVEQEKLEEELLKAGFHQEAVYKALDWLEDLARLQDTDEHARVATGTSTSMRIYTQQEIDGINTACRGFFYFS